MKVRAETKAALGDAEEIARAQLVRFRRRLGTLTYDQELQIEGLLISTVEKVWLVTAKVIEVLAKNPAAKLE